jgi:hypothetical protein
MPSFAHDLQQNGYAWVRNTLQSSIIADIGSELQLAIDQSSHDSVIQGSKQIVGVRNLMAVWPECIRLGTRLLGYLPDGSTTSLHLVRVLFFDKPPGRSWALPLHRDETIAIAKHPPLDEIPPGFSRPTIKAGVFHIVAPPSLLDQMLTLRLHLDPMNEQNGSLFVVPGSHIQSPGGQSQPEIEYLRASMGDLLAMRPRLLHGSQQSRAGCVHNRRILHFEFAPTNLLPAPLQWHWEPT